MKTFDEQYGVYREAVEASFDVFLPQDPSSVLTEAMRYSLLAGGKRIRPVLTLAWCALCGGDIRAALPAAAAVEMIHTYSLIHDDLPCMDNDTLRRGRPTNHVIYGEAVALLAGSGLYDKAMETVLDFGAEYGLSDSQRLDSLKVLCSASGLEGILTGQVLDIKNSDVAVDRAYLERVNDLKTAAMLSASCVLGAVAAGADAETQARADAYGRAVGQAFQIRDDILDVISTPETLGKTPGKDSVENKTTFVDLLGMEGAQKEVLRLTEKALSLLDGFEKPSFLKELTERMCGREA
ncbi:MAG: polyprenyl synthetase family protein [Clostridia bacterium]|nr:polyprenyl synthetase family protein [Clostridia bacterium]